jgi:PPOX class probable F420-dependent enzyme
MDVTQAQEFLGRHRRAVLATRRRDGSPQMSPILAVLDGDGCVVISSRETAMKTRNIRRDPQVSLCVVNDQWYGEWIQVDGTADVLSLPEAMEPLVDYYRRGSGEHPDWDDYRAAMERERRVLLRVTIDRAGPNRAG